MHTSDKIIGACFHRGIGQGRKVQKKSGGTSVQRRGKSAKIRNRPHILSHFGQSLPNRGGARGAKGAVNYASVQ